MMECVMADRREQRFAHRGGRSMRDSLAKFGTGDSREIPCNH